MIDASYHAEATLVGYISNDLNWIRFDPQLSTVVPITIAVFPDDKWNLDTASKSDSMIISNICVYLFR